MINVFGLQILINQSIIKSWRGCLTYLCPFEPTGISHPVFPTRYFPPSTSHLVFLTQYFPPSISHPLFSTQYFPPSISHPVFSTRYVPPSNTGSISQTTLNPEHVIIWWRHIKSIPWISWYYSPRNSFSCWFAQYRGDKEMKWHLKGSRNNSHTLAIQFVTLGIHSEELIWVFHLLFQCKYQLMANVLWWVGPQPLLAAAVPVSMHSDHLWKYSMLG